MPLLARSRAVEVLIVASGREKSDEIPGANMGEHLARHGLQVEVARIVSDDVDVPNMILSHAAGCASSWSAARPAASSPR